MCLPRLKPFLCSSHGKPWQGSTRLAWTAWLQIGYLSMLLLLLADCHGDPATKPSCTTALCHRQLRTCPTADNFPFHQHGFSICSSRATRSQSLQPHHSVLRLLTMHPADEQQTPQKITVDVNTGFHWLHMETGLHKKLKREDKTCPMCAFKSSNPGLPAEGWDAFGLDEDSDGMSTMPFLIAQAICVPESKFRICLRAISPRFSQFLDQSQCNRLAKCLTWIRACHMNKA